MYGRLLYPFLFFILLSIIYNLVFKKLKPRNEAFRYLLKKIRFLFYLYVILIPLLLLTICLPFIPYYNILVLTLRWATILLTIVLMLEIILTLFFDLFIIKRQTTGLPYLFKDLVKFTVYFIMFLFVATNILHIKLTALLTTSAVFSIILGLALQDTLGNLFSGLAMHISKPYSIGDWIQSGNYIGVVDKIDWRSTTIKTLTNDYVTIPNSNISKVEIKNFSTPTKIHARILDIGVHYKHPPNKVKKALLKTALETEGVLHEPFPKVFLESFNDFSITYKIWIWIDNFYNYRIIESHFREKIWYKFKREGIEIPFPIRNIYHHTPETFEESINNTVKIIQRVDFLEGLEFSELIELANRIKHQIFSAGEVVFNQGDPGNTFYVINSGHLQVNVKNKCGEIVLVREMSKYDFFGEMSLLTGEPRSATVSAIEDTEVLVLNKGDLRGLLEKNEAIKEKISTVLAERQLRTQKSYEECEMPGEMNEEAPKKELETLSKQILRKITDFFSI